MKRSLILVGGVANTLFFIFHLWLGWNLHHAVQIPFPLRGLLEMFNIGGTLCIGFLAYASLAHRDELARTGAGRAAMVLALLLYATRGAGEFVFTPRANPLIVASCVAMAVVYLGAMLVPDRSRPRSIAA